MCDDQQVRMRCMPVIHGVTRVPRPPITYKGRVGRRIKHSSVPASSQSSAIRVQCMSVKVIARGFDMSVCGMSDWVNGCVSCAYPLVVVQEPVELQAPVSSLSRFDEECVRSEKNSIIVLD